MRKIILNPVVLLLTFVITSSALGALKEGWSGAIFGFIAAIGVALFAALLARGTRDRS